MPHFLSVNLRRIAMNEIQSRMLVLQELLERYNAEYYVNDAPLYLMLSMIG